MILRKNTVSNVWKHIGDADIFTDAVATVAKAEHIR